MPTLALLLIIIIEGLSRVLVHVQHAHVHVYKHKHIRLRAVKVCYLSRYLAVLVWVS